MIFTRGTNDGRGDACVVPTFYMKKYFFTLLAFFILIPHLQAYEQLVRVRILSRFDLKQVKIISPLAQIKMVDFLGKSVERIGPPDMPLEIKAVERKVELRIGSYKYDVNQLFITPPQGSTLEIKLGGELQRKFKGKVQIRSSYGSLVFVEELGLDDYVRGVLESELPAGFPAEAQKAQAIAIRSYALSSADRHLREGYNFCDLTHCQVYGGKNLPYRSLDEAVDATQKLIMSYEAKPIQALFHSTCGGHTSANQKVFGGKPLPYLQGVNDENFCERSPHYRWDNSTSLKILEEVLKKEKETNPRGEIKNIRIAEQEPDQGPDQGRVFKVALEGKRNFTLPTMEFISVVGRYLGWSKLKSNWFTVEVQDGEASFKGRGLGHGVGLCQWGARGMAEAGKKFPEILKHYYPEAQLIQR